MPHLFFSGTTDDKVASMAAEDEHDKENVLARTWKQMGSWLKSEDEAGAPPATLHEAPPVTVRAEERTEVMSEKSPPQEATTVPIRPSHNVIPSMPRPITFKRQDSERRERLYPHEPDHDERRATSSDRRPGTSCERKISPLCLPELANSIPKLMALDTIRDVDIANHDHHDFASTAGTLDGHNSDRHERDLETSSQYDWHNHQDILHYPDQLEDALSDLQIQNELEAKWILNLSMHFRDHSDREKFFITYAEEPNHWRRITVSCDYRFAPRDSLEADLKTLHYQRDKSARVYEAIRDSLPGIQFYPTVTNLKLETDDGRLHVHVTEDVNEIIEYPHLSSISHLDLPTYGEEDIEFEGHMSGFVYKVKTAHGPEVFIKKEIPGPEAIDEFLYEINALSALRDAENVIEIRGVVIDSRKRIKGVLLTYATSGALVDLLYDSLHHPSPSTSISLQRRLKWAQQTCAGLSSIHESGFVQGDFTLSNIVIDRNDNAHIIDINRRGCPIGWEPPEFRAMIENGGRVSMYIGVKSDLWQLGMVLWAMGEGVDEPERAESPLRWSKKVGEELPGWYKTVVEVCLSGDPRERVSAKDLSKRFPPAMVDESAHPGDLPNLEATTPTPGLESGVHLEHEVRRPSPAQNVGPGDIDADVEYIVPPATSLPEERPSTVIQQADPAHEGDAHKTTVQDDFNQSQQIGSVPNAAQPKHLAGDESIEPAVQDDPIKLEEIASLPVAAQPEAHDMPRPSSGMNHLNEPMARRGASPGTQAVPRAPEGTIADKLNLSNPSPMFELGKPQSVPTSSSPSDAPIIAVESSHQTTSVWREDDQATKPSPWLPDQSDRLANLAQDLGFPVMATLSPPAELSVVTTPLSDPPSAGLNEVSAILATASGVLSPSASAILEDSTAKPATEELGFPRLATFSPPATLPTSPPISSELVSPSNGVALAACAAEAHNDTSIPATLHTSDTPTSLRTNTFGLEVPPRHHESGADELSFKNDMPVSLLAEALHARNAVHEGECESAGEKTDVTTDLLDGVTASLESTELS